MTQVLSDNLALESSGARQVRGRLSGAWRREVAFVLARGAARLIIWLAALLAFDFLLDWQVELPGRARMGLLAVNLIVLLAVFYLCLLRHLKGFDPLRVALQVERLHPSLQSLLVSYVQLHDRPEGYAGTSPALVRAMCREAVLKVKPLNFGKIVRFRTLSKLFLMALLVVGLEAAAGAWQSDFLSVFVARMTDPACRLKYPTRTIIDKVAPGDAFPQIGARVEVSVVVHGDLPREATLFVKAEGSDRESFRMPVAADPAAPAPASASRPANQSTRRFAHTFDHVSRNFEYWVKVGDAVSDRYLMSVVTAPRMTTASVKAEYPAYTRKDSEPRELAGLEVLEGTKLTWFLEFDRPVRKVDMMIQTGSGADARDETVSLRLSANKRRAELPVPRTTERDKEIGYEFRVTDDQYGYVYGPDGRYTVRVVPDKPPVLQMDAFELAQAGTVDKELVIGFGATDEFGLSESRIIWRMAVPPGQTPVEHMVPIKSYAGNRTSVRELQPWLVRKTIPNLKPGDVVEYCVEVLDNRQAGTQGPNATRSVQPDTKDKKYTWPSLQVLTDADYDRRTEDQRKVLLEGIKGVKTYEDNAVPELRKLLTQWFGGGPSETRPASRPASRPAAGADGR